MFVMLPTPSDLLSESVVQVTSIFDDGYCCCGLIVHIRVAAIETVMTSVVVPSVCVSVAVPSKSFGNSAIIKMGESPVFIRECSKDARWASATAPASLAAASSTASSFTATITTSRRVRVVVAGDSSLTCREGSSECLDFLLMSSKGLGCYGCWNVTMTGYDTCFISDTVNTFTDLVNGAVLLHHEAAEFSNSVIRFLGIVGDWYCCVLKLGKMFLVVFVEIRDEMCLGLVHGWLCLPLEYRLVEDFR